MWKCLIAIFFFKKIVFIKRVYVYTKKGIQRKNIINVKKKKERDKKKKEAEKR